MLICVSYWQQILADSLLAHTDFQFLYWIYRLSNSHLKNYHIQKKKGAVGDKKKDLWNTPSSAVERPF